MGSSTQFWLTEHKLHCFSTNTALQASPVTLPSTSSPTYQLAQVASTETSVSYPLTGGNLFPSTPSTSFSSVVTNTSSPFWRADCIGLKGWLTNYHRAPDKSSLWCVLVELWQKSYMGKSPQSFTILSCQFHIFAGDFHSHTPTSRTGEGLPSQQP